MLLKINTVETLDVHLKSLQKHFDVGSATKAVTLAATSFIGTNCLLDDALLTIEELESQIKELKDAYSQKVLADESLSRILSYA